MGVTVMARRRESVLELLVMAPWWASVLMSAGAFVFVAYIIPAILGQQHRLFGPLARQLPSLAPMVALVFLLPAPVSAFRQWRARQLLHSHTGLDSIRAMSWQRFETLVAEAYRRAGYSVEETGGGGPDGGIDLIARKGGTFLVQCKQWKAYHVGVKEVRELFGLVAAERAAGGVLITSGRFTIEAEAFARGKPLDLIDGPRLLEFVRLVQNGQSAVPTTASTLERADEAAIPPICPACGRGMVLRTSKRGSNAGHRFWGCSGYPRCRGTVSV
jgi:restriction system protein